MKMMFVGKYGNGRGEGYEAVLSGRNEAPSKRFRFDYSKRFASSASRRPGNLSKRAAAKDYS
ncbi:hypothetical protein SNOG_00619 [Parastagonospora nodorum SN15]|uniref:Uncharacterized protein n=1 Tax=Phaeosphaeria nodorum (strain SN15 / ATCC MYA-4574 / FGSC 10173) TaxID=321614 RepID=Q0V5U5_PHANO|nr:hypothetical protein SNOG_00619 [Parastagonospora nodorum SN15]EAT92114.1 hypothetical protein SNOG_00619 [Parastagonospora nodorum SN15]